MYRFLQAPARVGRSSVAEGEIVYAVGDVHGRADLLEATLAWIDDDFARSGAKSGSIVTLGDIIDRGPGSFKALDLLRRPRPAGLSLVPLMGNHERVFLSFLQNPHSELVGWMARQCHAPLVELGLAVEDEDLVRPQALRDRIVRAADPDLLRLMSTFRRFHVSGDFAFVHASVDRRKSLEAQEDTELLWAEGGLPSGRFTRLVVHGHIVVDTPEWRGCFLGIDTGAYRTGKLTTARIGGTAVEFHST